MAANSDNFVCGVNFDAVLAIFCSYSYIANASEAVVKVAIDEEDYH